MATRRRDLDNMHEMLHSKIKNPQPMANYMLPEFTVEAKGGIPKANIKPVVPLKTSEARIEPTNVVNTELAKEFTGTSDRATQQQTLKKAAKKYGKYVGSRKHKKLQKLEAGGDKDKLKKFKEKNPIPPKVEIKPGESHSLEGGSDYFMSGSNVLSDVDLEGGNVIGVNTPNPGRLLRKNKKKKTK